MYGLNLDTAAQHSFSPGTFFRGVISRFNPLNDFGYFEDNQESCSEMFINNPQSSLHRSGQTKPSPLPDNIESEDGDDLDADGECEDFGFPSRA